MPRIELPPQGDVMAFRDWGRRLTELMRAEIPDVVATVSRNVVTWRYGSRIATLNKDADTWWFRFRGAGDAPSPTMASLFDSRHDEFTATNFARTLAGYFDDKFCTPRNPRD